MILCVLRALAMQSYHSILKTHQYMISCEVELDNACASQLEVGKRLKMHLRLVYTLNVKPMEVGNSAKRRQSSGVPSCTWRQVLPTNRLKLWNQQEHKNSLLARHCIFCS